MSQTYPLDAVIRKLSLPLPKVAPQTEKIVIFDTDKEEILLKTPFWKLGRDLRYYLVSTQNTAECDGPLCQVRDLATKRAISINVRYEASCEPGSESQIVQALFDGNHPGAVLNNLIERWVADFVRTEKKNGTDVIQHYFDLCGDLLEYISHKAREEVGLNLEVELYLKPDNLEDFPIESKYFPVRVKDADDVLNLKFSTALQVDEGNRINAILNYNRLPQLEALLTQQLKKYFLEELTLHEFFFELNSTVRDRVRADLNETLHSEGRELAYLSLESTSTPPLPNEFEQIDYKVSCDIKECPDQIVVEHKLQLSLENVGKYRAAGIDDLAAWAKGKLNRITQTTLFEKTYVDLLLDFDEKEIKQQMEKEAKSIGYTVKQLIVIPELDEIKLKDGFSLERDGSFMTRDTRVEVKLSIVVTGRIRNLRKIERYLNPQTDILAEMGEVALREVERLMHGIEPERFYMRFSYSEIAGETPVEQELINWITKKLEAFHVEEINVIPKILDTDLTIRFQELQEGSPYFFEVQAFPLRGGGRREQVSFRVGFEVLGVHKQGWYIFRSRHFQSREDEIDKIERILEEEITTRLDTVPIEYLQYTDFSKLGQIRQILEPIKVQISRATGLMIDIFNIRRLETKAELAEQEKLNAFIESQSQADKKATEMGHKALVSDLDKLYKDRRELISAEIDDEELEQIDERIEKITDRLSSYPIDGDTPQPKQLTADATPTEFRLDDYLKAEQKGVESRGEQQAIESKPIEDATDDEDQTDEENQ